MLGLMPLETADMPGGRRTHVALLPDDRWHDATTQTSPSLQDARDAARGRADLPPEFSVSIP